MWRLGLLALCLCLSGCALLFQPVPTDVQSPCEPTKTYIYLDGAGAGVFVVGAGLELDDGRNAAALSAVVTAAAFTTSVFLGEARRRGCLEHNAQLEAMTPAP